MDDLVTDSNRLRCLAELVSVRPVSGALIDYPHTFVDPALGFAVAVMYWTAQCSSMATLTAAAVRLTDDFLIQGNLGRDPKAGITVALCFITLLSNICGIKVGAFSKKMSFLANRIKAYGRLERIFKWFKLLLLITLFVLMILVRANGMFPQILVELADQSPQYVATAEYYPHVCLPIPISF